MTLNSVTLDTRIREGQELCAQLLTLLGVSVKGFRNECVELKNGRMTFVEESHVDWNADGVCCKGREGGIAKQMQEKRGNPCLSAGNKLSLLQL